MHCALNTEFSMMVQVFGQPSCCLWSEQLFKDPPYGCTVGSICFFVSARLPTSPILIQSMSSSSYQPPLDDPLTPPPLSAHPTVNWKHDSLLVTAKLSPTLYAAQLHHASYPRCYHRWKVHISPTLIQETRRWAWRMENFSDPLSSGGISLQPNQQDGFGKMLIYKQSPPAGSMAPINPKFASGSGLQSAGGGSGGVCCDWLVWWRCAFSMCFGCCNLADKVE